MVGNWTEKLVQLGVVGAVAGGSFAFGSLTTQQLSGAPSLAAPVPETLPASVSTVLPSPAATLGPNFIADAAQKTSPAVVRIDTEKVRQVNSRSPFEQFFPEFFGPGGNNAPGNPTPRTPRNYRERSAGSGFILDKEGTVITNAHVVEGVDKVSITLNDGRKVSGKVVGVDSLTDIAVVKIDGRPDLPTVPLGDSDKLRPGEWVIAVGNPLGLDHTVTAGIISALNRSSNDVGVREEKRLDFIQTDAAINPGNSGGPLVNIYGQVIGINTAIRADGQGIGFAIPINKVKEISASLLRDGRVIRPYIGVNMVSLTPELLQQLKEDPNSGRLPDADKGVWVREVIKGSPAARAGLRADDVIIEIDGEPVTEAKQVQTLISARKVGETVAVKVQRNGKASVFQIKTVELTKAPVS